MLAWEVKAYNIACILHITPKARGLVRTAVRKCPLQWTPDSNLCKDPLQSSTGSGAQKEEVVAGMKVSLRVFIHHEHSGFNLERIWYFQKTPHLEQYHVRFL